MKICFIAPANNYHTKKWCKWFVEREHEVHVISFIDDKIENVIVHYIETGVNVEASDFDKIKYLFKATKIKKIVRKINPDIINAHYATSYGTVVALSGIKGYFLSIWGTDIYGFPQKGILHKIMLKYSLKKAKYIFSTSKAMAREAQKYTNKKIHITPFGVDVNLFSKQKRTRKIDDSFVIGTVKALEPVYGIDYLLRAVSIIKTKYSNIPIKVRIAGNGILENEYKELAKELNINQNINWLGFISQENVAKEWANMDLGIIYSLSESFGVSAVEAEACETPIIISNVPGLMEATLPGESSLVIKGKDENALARAIVELYFDAEKRKNMGKCGRAFVCKEYEINKCFYKIEGYFIKHVNNKYER